MCPGVDSLFSPDASGFLPGRGTHRDRRRDINRAKQSFLTTTHFCPSIVRRASQSIGSLGCRGAADAAASVRLVVTCGRLDQLQDLGKDGQERVQVLLHGLGMTRNRRERRSRGLHLSCGLWMRVRIQSGNVGPPLVRHSDLGAPGQRHHEGAAPHAGHGTGEHGEGRVLGADLDFARACMHGRARAGGWSVAKSDRSAWPRPFRLLIAHLHDAVHDARRLLLEQGPDGLRREVPGGEARPARGEDGVELGWVRVWVGGWVGVGW